MEKRILQTYSVWAKEELERQIEVSLKTLGIHSDKDIRKARRAGDLTIIEGDPNSYPADLLNKRSQIVARGYRNVIEEFAYTWFNRFVALRYMEIHDFLPHGFRVLSNRSGGVEPEILKNLSLVRADLHLDMDLCASLKERGKTEGLFRYVLLRQCGALADILPMLFERESDYLELLLPKSLLIGETVLTRLLEIPENAFMEDVEIIGWMYQFYISAKKDAVNKEKKTITKDTLPAVTQLFTPKWIVRYMAENSVGRIWLESYPASPLRSAMPYYVDEAEQTEEVQRQLDAIRYRNVDPKDLRVIDPCCGSGHILVYVFDLLYRMYEEKGYSAREIPTMILRNNLVGLDVDKRAAQLSSFALIMKARRANNRFFKEEYYTVPRVYELRDSSYLESINYRQHLTNLGAFTEEEATTVKKLVETFRYGKTVGSLIKVPAIDFAAVERVLYKLEHEVVASVFDQPFTLYGAPLLKALLEQAKAMSAKYDVMITNPPYLGTSAMEPAVKDYAARNYPNSKADLFAMFMETGFVKPNGFTSMINMHGWMFLASYEKLRVSILASQDTVLLAHLGPRAFDEISGEVVQTVSFVFRKQKTKEHKGIYDRLVFYPSEHEKEIGFLSPKNRFIRTQEEFTAIQGVPFTAYWAAPAVFAAFKASILVGNVSEPRVGMATANNDRFVRLWFEIEKKKFAPNCVSREDAKKSRKKWFPFAMGGEQRKWYGNNDTVVNWENDGYEIQNFKDEKTGRIRSHNYNLDYIFSSAITWTVIGTDRTSFRYCPAGFLYSNSGYGMFCDNDGRKLFLLGFMNSVIAASILQILSPSMGFESGYLRKLPLITKNQEEINKLVRDCIELSKNDWDCYEISWEFHRHHLIQLTAYISDTYSAWEAECRERFDTLKANEEELNRIFIDIYGLQDELTPEVKDEDVTVRLADKERDIRSLISYLVGVVMGRYSLDVDGLAYAGGDWDPGKYRSYQPDDDGIVPIYAELGMEDGLTARIIHLIKRIYGENSYRANIDFIADALGKKSSESSEETLNRYLNEGFYADHLKIYQKRPIYWLFSSGKHSGFKCLIYMHRYTPDTLARINGKYFLPESTRLKNELEELQLRIARSVGRDRVRLEKERQKLAAAYSEALEYGQVLDHMANRYIAIDLDDGVKENYAKFQGVELVTDSGIKVKKDLLAPIK